MSTPKKFKNKNYALQAPLFWAARKAALLADVDSGIAPFSSQNAAESYLYSLRDYVHFLHDYIFDEHIDLYKERRRLKGLLKYVNTTS